MVTVLTGPGDGPLDVRWMPGADTGHFSEALVRFPGEFFGAPSAGDALEAMAFGDGDAIDHFILFEDAGDVYFFLEEAFAVCDLVGDAAAVDLNLHEVCFLLFEGCLLYLGVGEDSNDGAVLGDAF